MSILMHAPVAGAYLGLGWWAWRDASAPAAVGATGPATSNSRLGTPAIAAGDPHGQAAVPPIERFLLLLAWLAHGALLVLTVIRPEGLQFGFALALSSTMWLAVAVYWIESLYFGLVSMRLLVLPIAGLCVLLPLWFPGTLMPRVGHNLALEVHLLVALAAYGLLTIAALHALLMAALDRRLHRRDSGVGPVGVADEPLSQASLHRRWQAVEQAVLAQLPPLLTMERLLFRMLAAGFTLLTLTVVSGLVFSEEMFGRAFRFEHKTLFTLLSWLIFAALLAGRAIYGWRGRVALRWTLAGFMTMLLAYVGSRFVLEVILHR